MERFTAGRHMGFENCREVSRTMLYQLLQCWSHQPRRWMESLITRLMCSPGLLMVLKEEDIRSLLAQSQMASFIYWRRKQGTKGGSRDQRSLLKGLPIPSMWPKIFIPHNCTVTLWTVLFIKIVNNCFHCLLQFGSCADDGRCAVKAYWLGMNIV